MRIGTFARWIAAAGAAAASSPQLRDVSGQLLDPLKVAGKAAIVFFVSTDCPISNSYAPEIQRICKDYGTKGVSCSLLYEDVDVTPDAVRQHLKDFQYRNIPAAIDAQRVLVKRVSASVTPEAVVIDKSGNVRYRGRIDNLYADFGKRRREVTQHDLTDALDAVLVGKRVANPETKGLGCFIVMPEVLESDPPKK